MNRRTHTSATLFLICFCSLLWPDFTAAQENLFSVSITHPIPVGDTFYSEFNGVGGIDIKYAQPLGEYLFLSGNLGYLRSRYTQDDRINLSMFRAGIGLSRPAKLSPRAEFRPELEIGYALMRFYNETIAQENETSPLRRAEAEHLNGWRAAIVASWNYQLDEKFSLGLITDYEFVYIPRDNFGRPYNQEMHSIGLGLLASIKL